jgi:tRNA-dihydrouridine synthase
MPGPMEGVMSPVFCRTVNELDLLDYWITPFIRLSNAVPGLSTFKHKLRLYDIENKPVIVQLLGNNPAIFADAAKRLQELGIAGINLNFGCPSKQVLSNNGGGRLLSDPQLMVEIINAVTDACPDLSVSVKLRTGYVSSSEMESFLPELSKLDIDFIIVHSRTVKEMYDTILDGSLRISQAVKLASPVSVIASGDIFSVEDAKKMLAESLCAGITVARGLLKDPFLIRRLEIDLNAKTEDSATSKKDSAGASVILEDDSRTVFFKKMCEIARKEAEYYRRSGFLEIARFMWGVDSPKFKILLGLSDSEMLDFF